MRLVLSQTKKGLPSFCELCMKASAFGITSAASKSFIRSWPSGPVSLMVCLPTRPNFGSTVGSSLSFANDKDDPPVDPKIGQDGKQTINDNGETGPDRTK